VRPRVCVGKGPTHPCGPASRGFGGSYGWVIRLGMNHRRQQYDQFSMVAAHRRYYIALDALCGHAPANQRSDGEWPLARPPNLQHQWSPAVGAQLITLEPSAAAFAPASEPQHPQHPHSKQLHDCCATFRHRHTVNQLWASSTS